MIVYRWKNIADDRARQNALNDWARRFEVAAGKYRKDDRGRPCADGAYLSIAHTEGICLMAVSDTAVGIDVERAGRRTRSGLPPIGEWTKIEAYAKYLGTGMRREYLRRKLPEDLIYELNVGEGYVCHVCSRDRAAMIVSVG